MHGLRPSMPSCRLDCTICKRGGQQTTNKMTARIYTHCIQASMAVKLRNRIIQLFGRNWMKCLKGSTTWQCHWLKQYFRLGIQGNLWTIIASCHGTIINNRENKTSRIDGTIHHQKWQNVTVTVANICNFCVGRHFQTHFWGSTFWLVSTVGNSRCKPHFFL